MLCPVRLNDENLFFSDDNTGATHNVRDGADRVAVWRYHSLFW